MYVTQVANNVDLTTYLTYTPPDGYELVSEDHKNDEGVITYRINKDFYYEPYTVYYGTATKSFTYYESATKYFYYKKKAKQDIYNEYWVIFTVSNGQLRCQCSGVSNIPGTDNGNFTLQVRLSITDGHNSSGLFRFSWVMKDGINESQSCIGNIYVGGDFLTRSDWENDNGDGTKTYYTFKFDTSSLVNGF